MALADWRIKESGAPDEPASQETRPPIGVDARTAAELEAFEAAKCTRGGPETTAFVDFSTQDPTELALVNAVAERFSATMSASPRSPDLTQTEARSVRFLFELKPSGSVANLTVFADDSAAPLRDFVTQLVLDSQPYPDFQTFLEPCYTAAVVSAIFDF